MNICGATYFHQAEVHQVRIHNLYIYHTPPHKMLTLKDYFPFPPCDHLWGHLVIQAQQVRLLAYKSIHMYILSSYVQICVHTRNYAPVPPLESH